MTFLGIATVKGTLENQLTDRRTQAAETMVSRVESTTIDVPPYSATDVTIHWKLLGQHGTVRLRTRSGHYVDVPYSLPVVLTAGDVEAHGSSIRRKSAR